MILEEQKIIIPKPIIPKALKGKVKVFTNCNVLKDEVLLFNRCLVCMAEYIKKENIDLSDYFSLNVVFTEEGSLSFKEQEEKNNGSQIYLAVYRLNKMRKINSTVFTAFVFVEELAHYFLRIYDETLIKYKIVEILNYMIPDLTIEDVKGWGLNGL